MWIARATFEELVTLREQLAAALARTGVLKEQISVAHAQANWLADRVNQLELERAQLLHARTGATIPVPEVTIPPPDATRMEHAVRAVVGKPLDEHEEAIFDVNAAQAASGLFEDVGDELAGKMGLRHDDLGEVVSARA